MQKKVIRWIIVLAFSGLVIGGGFAFYMFNRPHRDVQSAPVDYEVSAETLVQEFLDAPQSATRQYLGEANESKILAVSGIVHAMDTDMKGQQVVLLKGENMEAGVSCTFMETTNANAEQLEPGEWVTIKGVIQAGARYDEDFGLYEDAILEKCDLYH